MEERHITVSDAIKILNAIYEDYGDIEIGIEDHHMRKFDLTRLKVVSRHGRGMSVVQDLGSSPDDRSYRVNPVTDQVERWSSPPVTYGTWRPLISRDDETQER